LIPSFAAGFNAVANNIYLILLPILLDLLLWFGPHLRLKQMLLPFVNDTVASVREMSTPETRQMLTGIEQVWTAFLEQYNLLSTLTTFPVGVPSLMASQSPLLTPVGSPTFVEINGPFAAMGLWLLTLVIGLALGSLYFSIVARSTAPEPNEPLQLALLGWQTLQVAVLVIVLFAIFILMFLPAIFITSILSLLSPVLASVALLGMSFIAIWLLIPLIFSPHGIFALRQNGLSAMLTSARMVRFFLPGTGLFLLIAVVLYQGLGALWRTPPDSSWMALVGVVGHAFISTALLAASFIYYRSGHDFVLSLRKSTNSA
jgi:hypothetical protein